jgi:hypothetical protein
LAGGERHPTSETALWRIPAKIDKRKTAKAVIPLRLIDILIPICRDLTSTCWVQIPLVLTRIFLTGYPSILYIVYVNRSRCLQAIKIPPNFKKAKSERFQNMANQLTETSFFLFGELFLPMVI